MDSNFVIKSLAGYSFNDMYDAQAKAFKDYPFQWSREHLEKTIHRRGFDPALSFGAFDNNELVSFTWNGIGELKGVPTAYDTGTGTIENYRGKGLASKIFEFSVPYLKEAGIKQYILEVLEENAKAISVYSKQGFKVTRSFDCYRVNSSDWKNRQLEIPAGILIVYIDLNFQEQMTAMCDFELSWQNNFAALRKNSNDFRMLGAFRHGQLVGYGIIEPESGDIPQLAVVPHERGKGIGSCILQELISLNTAEIIKIVNIQSDQETIKQFIVSNGIPKIVRQYEMKKEL